MLSLQLKSGEYLTIGEDIAVQIFQTGSSFRVAVKAPREIPIVRGEVLERQGEDRPGGLRVKPSKRPSQQARDARRLQSFAEKKERREKTDRPATEKRERPAPERRERPAAAEAPAEDAPAVQLGEEAYE